MEPPLTYYGAKVKMAPKIVALLPDHTHYVEPFAGSLAVLLAKPQSTLETVNDLDGDLMTFWRVLRDRPDELERVCTWTPHSREEYALSHEHGPEVEDELERARRVWVGLTQGWTGTLKPKSWRRDRSDRARVVIPTQLGAFVDRLAPAALRLHHVTLESCDALELIRSVGQHEGTCIYADPPYLDTTPNYAQGTPGEDWHREVAEALHACRASVVLSGYHSPLYDDLYDGWERHENDSHTMRGIVRERTEVLWIKQSGYGTTRRPDRQLTDAMF